MDFDARFQRVCDLRESIAKNRDRLIRMAVRDLRFTVTDCAKEVDITLERLLMLGGMREELSRREPLGGSGSRVALMLSYNGSAWLNSAISSIYVVGNRVDVKFSSKGRDVMEVTEAMYQPIFGDDVTFYRGSGRSFLERALADPEVSAVVAFGFDANMLPYEKAVRESGKKFVFEGPGQDPFIVFADADLELALEDLMTAKFMYSGQTCTAPKRIFVQRDVYDTFLEAVVDRVRRLVVGDPEDPRTNVSPVASSVAVERIRVQLEEAVEQGARILTGGRIEGNLIEPTVVRDAVDSMLGMREEVFGPVLFTSPFESADEVLSRARNHKYGLRAAVFGGEEAARVARELAGEPYCHPVPDYTFGRFGTVAYNQTRSESWRGALITKPIGGYGYSGWIWETVEGRFRLKQGPKLFSLETSRVQ
ncbi:MAG: aldehyde dehydrogenase family protein [Desulfacinum sp.]|jgi:acyl-CoA reductase-like NAD-dependent aldehyde dehydrogenase|nr:aldehyde dehydrogenase family protein [Desulfacinum sp.]MBZ4659744.1 Aldehyde Dehydrogenase [Desulfacinum sp.]